MKKAAKLFKKKHLLINILIILGLCIFTIIWNNCRDHITKYSSYVENTIGLFSLLIAIASVILIIMQLSESMKLQEAEFILNLNQSFVGNDNYAKVYTELENSVLKNIKPTLSRIEVSNYLTFFETVYLLLEKKVIHIKTLDDLFGYRFFLAIHNETIQEMKLVESPYNFRNIYYLEAIWMEYRKQNGLAIYREENNLCNACKAKGKEQLYNEIITNFQKGNKK